MQRIFYRWLCWSPFVGLSIADAVKAEVSAGLFTMFDPLPLGGRMQELARTRPLHRKTSQP